MRLCSKHAQPGKALLDSFNLLSGARTCLRGAARRNLSMAATAQQQGASPVRAGLMMITRQAAAQRSRVARTQAMAQKRHAPSEVLVAPPEALSAPMMTMGQAPRQTQKPRSLAQKHCKRQRAIAHSSEATQPRALGSRKTTQPRAVRSSKSTQPNVLRAARAAQRAQSRSQRASTLAQRRRHVAEVPPPTDCSQAAESHLPKVQRSRATRAHAAAQKKHAHVDETPAVASASQQAPQCARKRLCRRATEPAMFSAAARKAELARGGAQRADILLQKRSQDKPASATCSQTDHHAQQQIPMQAETAPSAGHQPPCASAAAAEEHMPPAQQDLRAAEAQAQNSSGMEPFAEQGGQSMGRPGMPEQAKEESRSPRVVNPTAAAQPHQPSTAEPAARALQSSPAGKRQTQRQDIALGSESGRTGMSPVTPVQHSHRSGRHSARGAMSSGGPSKRSRERSCPAAAAEHYPSAPECPLSHGKAAKPFQAGAPSLSAKENVHTNSPQRPAQAAAAPPSSRLATSSSSAASPLCSGALPTTAMNMIAYEQPAGHEQLPESRAAPEPLQAGPPSLCVKEAVHPMPSKDSSGPAAIKPPTMLMTSSSLESSLLSSDTSLCTSKSTPGCAPCAGRAQPSVSHGPPEPQVLASSQGSKDAPHPKPAKGKPTRRPDWRTGSPDQAHFWLMYKKVFHRGGACTHYQTMSVQWPEETLRLVRPDYGDKSLLKIETRLEDDITIPSEVRVAKYQHDKILRRNGGLAPPPGHKDHTWYITFCEACEGYY